MSPASPERPPTQPATSDNLQELVAAVRALRDAMEHTNAQMARLTNAVESLLAPTMERAPRSASHLTPIPAAVPLRRKINWVVGPTENLSWAYGNNARRLAAHIGSFDHELSSSEPCDVAVYFDAIVAQRYPVEADKKVLRIGGPRPLTRLFGDDTKALAEFLAGFDAVIALSADLFQRTARLHPNVHFIPNGIDLSAWPPVRAALGRPLTAGFAASLKSKAEIEIKGLAIAQSAAAKCGIPLLQTSKGQGQIPPDRMHSDFYSRIDLLLHPVAAGREGTSNVIMEALAAGVPVVTTVDAGFHGEFLQDRRTALIRRRDVDEFAAAIKQLQSDNQLRSRLSTEGRRFAEAHHSIAKVATQYEAIFQQLGRKPTLPQRRKVAFVPFWEPVDNFGSSRLRAKYPAGYLSRTGAFEAHIGYRPDADVVVVVQMCSDDVMRALETNRNQFVIYDVCDKYYEKPRLFRHLAPPVDSRARFYELAARSNLIVVPSQELKIEVASRLVDKAVKYVPEPVDYQASPRKPSAGPRPVALWFGNPDRGNFESVSWMLRRLRDEHGFELRLVSRKSFFRAHPEFQGAVIDWSPEAMSRAFEGATLCVLGYHEEEQAKSANRFITAMMHGVPTLVAGSPACREILDGAGHSFAMLTDERSLDWAVTKLKNDPLRDAFVTSVQRYLSARHGDAAVTTQYVSLLQDHTFRAEAFRGAARRIAFVSHNLALGEGAPMSLFELVKGLRKRGIEPFVFSPVSGPLADFYRREGIALEIFDQRSPNGVKVINNGYAKVRDAFTEFLRTRGIEAVVCNTVKAAPYVELARESNLRGLIIVRESYAAAERFSHFEGEARLAAIKGLTHAQQVVFVARSTREVYQDQAFKGEVHVIPNGIALDRFEEARQLDKAAARARLQLPQDDVIALCVGSVSRRKGQLQLVHAFTELPASVRRRARLVILGAGHSNYVTEFKSEIDKLSPEQRARVTVAASQSDVGPYYAAADIFLMNSQSEAYPRSIVEALHWGLPVLATPVFGVQEQIRQGFEGFLYEFDDMATWRCHFSALTVDPELRARMSAEASRSFWRLTSYPEMLLAYQTLVARILPSLLTTGASQQPTEAAHERRLGVSEESVRISGQLPTLSTQPR